MDWRCSTAGMSVIDAERIGLRTADRTGLMAFDGSAETPQSVSCRIISDVETGRVVGATVYGPDSHRLIEPLRRAIVEGKDCEDLFHASEKIANAGDEQKRKRLKAR